MIQIIVLAILLLGVPTMIGTLFGYGEKKGERILYAWINGQILLWAGFQLICVPFILQIKSFSLVVLVFEVYMGILLLVAFGVALYRRRFPRVYVLPEKIERKKIYYILWGIFGLLLIYQLVQAGCMAYEEGDDAFYVAVSTITAESDSMYFVLPYTGGVTGLDARHGLAPLPVWVAFLAKVSGIHAATVAQVLLPMVLIAMTYGIYYLLGVRLLAKQREALPLFMIFVAMLILFGGYSLYTAENFLLVRTAQGKAVLANIIIPFLFLLLYRVLERLHQEEKPGGRLWFLIAVAMVAGCLCTTLGTVLICMLIGIVGIITAISYRKWQILFPLAAGCVIPILFAFLYWKLG